ncbi:MAG: DmsE family decaheme c-type cytochrome [Steroidobacteraceae bacterium]
MRVIRQTLRGAVVAIACIAGAAAAGPITNADTAPAAAAPTAAPGAPVPGTPSTGSRAEQALRRDAQCTRCHDESETKPILAIYQTKHGVRGDPSTPTCQDCHGESEKHLRGAADAHGRAPPDIVFNKGSYPVSDPKTRATQCLTCHQGTNRTRWDGGVHQANDMACNNCHTIHAASDPLLTRNTQPEVCFTCHKEQRADTLKVSTHPLDAGKMACTDCHNPHGAAGPKLLKFNTVNETCWQCHADKRGPFLWEHQPVVEDCTNCHTPHGSNITPLLKSRPPFLCQECHDGPHNSKNPVGPNAAGFQGGLSGVNAAGTGLIFPSTQAAARGCMNCHAMVHGSNDPAGAFLHR